jgi:hypothetical protein
MSPLLSLRPRTAGPCGRFHGEAISGLSHAQTIEIASSPAAPRNDRKCRFCCHCERIEAIPGNSRGPLAGGRPQSSIESVIAHPAMCSESAAKSRLRVEVPTRACAVHPAAAPGRLEQSASTRCKRRSTSLVSIAWTRCRPPPRSSPPRPPGLPRFGRPLASDCGGSIVSFGPSFPFSPKLVVSSANAGSRTCSESAAKFPLLVE